MQTHTKKKTVGETCNYMNPLIWIGGGGRGLEPEELHGTLLDLDLY